MSDPIGKMLTLNFSGWLARLFLNKTKVCDNWMPRYDANGDVYLWLRERP